METKEIHFFANLCDVECCSEYDLEDMHVDYVSTRNAINDKTENKIKTTQICFLRDAYTYKEWGWKVFLHYNGKIVEVEDHMEECNKDMKSGYDVSRLFIGGAFGEIN